MNKRKETEHIAPWEKAFDRVLTPLDDFIHRQTTSGILLMLCAIVALFVANSRWSDAYHHLLEMQFTVGMQGFQLSKSLHHWINEGLMALFFSWWGWNSNVRFWWGNLPIQSRRCFR